MKRRARPTAPIVVNAEIPMTGPIRFSIRRSVRYKRFTARKGKPSARVWSNDDATTKLGLNAERIAPPARRITRIAGTRSENDRNRPRTPCSFREGGRRDPSAKTLVKIDARIQKRKRA